MLLTEDILHTVIAHVDNRQLRDMCTVSASVHESVTRRLYEAVSLHSWDQVDRFRYTVQVSPRCKRLSAAVTSLTIIFDSENWPRISQDFRLATIHLSNLQEAIEKIISALAMVHTLNLDRAFPRWYHNDGVDFGRAVASRLALRHLAISSLTLPLLEILSPLRGLTTLRFTLNSSMDHVVAMAQLEAAIQLVLSQLLTVRTLLAPPDVLNSLVAHVQLRREGPFPHVHFLGSQPAGEQPWFKQSIADTFPGLRGLRIDGHDDASGRASIDALLPHLRVLDCQYGYVKPNSLDKLHKIESLMICRSRDRYRSTFGEPSALQHYASPNVRALQLLVTIEPTPQHALRAIVHVFPYLQRLTLCHVTLNDVKETHLDHIFQSPEIAVFLPPTLLFLEFQVVLPRPGKRPQSQDADPNFAISMISVQHLARATIAASIPLRILVVREFNNCEWESAWEINAPQFGALGGAREIPRGAVLDRTASRLKDLTHEHEAFVEFL
ncbi:hypothetical protein BKA62DRAFT_713778 [Auriculariales sp. MPI-PUGE-AT-0066]|nr:hypothetical protein BKA62DRAFT_713778 [Auriculariales sp. MPI-PUGE-AT-0066]